MAERETELHGKLQGFLETVTDRLRALREDPAGAEVTPVALDAATGSTHGRLRGKRTRRP